MQFQCNFKTKNMLLKVVAIALLTICAENRIITPARAWVQAFPLPKFIRHEPLSYDDPDYYSTVKPEMNFYQKIQYAPLYGRIGQKNRNRASEYTKATPTLSSYSTPPFDSYEQQKYRNSFNKDHLEPRVPRGQEVHETKAKCYDTEHKVEVLPTVSRSPGHNAIYRTLTELALKENPVQVNYMEPYEVYKNLDARTTTAPFAILREPPREPSHELPREVPENARTYIFPKHKYVLNPNKVAAEGPAADKTKRHYSPYAKIHRLHLNIARIYSPRQVPPKSPVFADTYSQNLGSLPIHAQAYIPSLVNEQPDDDILYPKDNRKDLAF